MNKLLIIFICGLCLQMAHYAAVAQEEKFEPRVDLSYYRVSDDFPYIKVLVRKKIDRRYYPVAGIMVKVFFKEESDNTLMGTVATNSKGEGIVEMPEKLMRDWYLSSEFDYIAVIDESDSTEIVNESITIHEAKIILQANEQNELKATVLQLSDSLWIPVEEVELKFFVKRSFGRLPLSEDLIPTDEEGIAEIEYTAKIPGDAEGKIVLGCALEDHEEFGNITALVTTKWGTPFVDNNEAFHERTLWATRDRTPYWLLIFPNLVILGVWGIIVYLVIQVFKIKKLSNLK